MKASSVSSSYTGNVVNAKSFLMQSHVWVGRCMVKVKTKYFFWGEGKESKRKCFISHGTFMILDAV